MSRAARNYQAGEHEAAAAACLAIIRREPAHFDALHLLGVLCCRRGAYADAVSFLRRAEQAQPAGAQLYANLGSAYLGLQLYAAAEDAFRRALGLSAPSPAGLTDLGNALAGQRRHDAAESAFRQALALDAGYAPATYNLGRCLVGQDRHADAITAFRQLLDQGVADPARLASVAGELATALAAVGRCEQAAEVCATVLAQIPHAPTLAWNYSLALLCLGRYAEGWRHYEARWRVPGHDPPHPRASILDLSDVAGRSVLVLAEQGRGDLLQFARYVPMLVARGARVSLQTYPDVAPVLLGTPGVRVITLAHAEPAADRVTPLLSLPLAFGTTLKTVPRAVPYLHVPPDRMAAWTARLGPRRQPRVGIVWRGLQHIPHRSVPLAALTALTARQEVAFHVLQQDVTPDDRDWLMRHGFADHSAALRDFGDTAALITLMDLVITIDTSVAHLAGGLGAPVWVMLAFNADWRWLRDRSDSPWYPTARLFRQPAPGVWDPVITDVAAALAAQSGMSSGRDRGRDQDP